MTDCHHNAEGPCEEADQACTGDTSLKRHGMAEHTHNKKARTNNLKKPTVASNAAALAPAKLRHHAV